MAGISIDDLIVGTRFTAFIDIFGWKYITSGDVSELLARVAYSRHRKIEPTFNSEENERLRNYARRIDISLNINESVRVIIASLNGWMIPHSCGRGFRTPLFPNRHIVLVRGSDSIFLITSSYTRLVVAVCEVLRRGLKSGVLFRAGLSVGYVKHLPHQLPQNVDPLSLDRTMAGTGITTSCDAEASAKGLGVRAVAHSEMVKIIKRRTDFVDNVLLRRRKGLCSRSFVEYPWWSNTNDYSNADIEKITLTDWNPTVVGDLINELKTGDAYEWNRASAKGMKVINEHRFSRMWNHEPLRPILLCSPTGKD